MEAVITAMDSRKKIRITFFIHRAFESVYS
jgi:hypothetical protein